MKPRTLLALLLLAVPHLIASSPDPDPPDPPQPSSTNTPIVEIQPGLLQIGLVRLDKHQRTVTLPAAVNLRESPVEYLLVTTSGKIHESILRTEAQPIHLHLAMLLLGTHGAGTNTFPTNSATPIPGDPLTVEIQWQTPAGNQKSPGEEFVLNRITQAPLSRGDWTYTGSILYQGTFLAQQEGSIIALFLDPVALINNPRPGREDDEIWLPNPKAIPPDDTPVEVVLRLQDKKRPTPGPRQASPPRPEAPKEPSSE